MTERRRGQTVVTSRGALQAPPHGPATVRRLPVSSVVKDAHMLQRYLMDLEARLAALDSRDASNVFGDGVLLKGLAVSGGGVATYIQHRLGRPYVGYFPTRIQTASVTWNEVALPSNMSTSTWIALEFSAAAAVDLYVF